MKKFRFYKEEGKWYVDLPAYIEAGGEKSALEMIFGADEFLEEMKEEANEVFIEINTNYDDSEYNALMRATNKLDSGQFYIWDKQPWNADGADCHVMWLCDVMLFVFDGVFPPLIYFKSISREDYLS